VKNKSLKIKKNKKEREKKRGGGERRHTKRLELLFLVVLALPKASKMGFA
jgi:hypothetical protein